MKDMKVGVTEMSFHDESVSKQLLKKQRCSHSEMLHISLRVDIPKELNPDMQSFDFTLIKKVCHRAQPMSEENDNSDNPVVWLAL